VDTQALPLVLTFHILDAINTGRKFAAHRSDCSVKFLSHLANFLQIFSDINVNSLTPRFTGAYR